MVKYLLLMGLFILPGLVFSQANQLTKEEQDQGWQLLFDGTLQSVREHWTTYSKGNSTINQLPGHIKVENETGGAWFGKTSGGADIRTKKKWTNFIIKFQYRISDNSGFFYRADVLTGAIFHNTVEYALLNSLQHINPQRTNASGSIYDVYVPYHEIYHTWNTGMWNTVMVIGKGDSVYHYHNDSLAGQFDGNGEEFKQIISGDIPVPGTNHISKWAPTPCYTVEASSEGDCDHANPYRKTGYFGFQTSYGGTQQYRGMKLLDITEGCLDSNYFEYHPQFMANDPAACQTPKVIPVVEKNSQNIFSLKQKGTTLALNFSTAEKFTISLIGVDGILIDTQVSENKMAAEVQLPNPHGIYFVKVTSNGSEQIRRVINF